MPTTKKKPKRRKTPEELEQWKQSRNEGINRRLEERNWWVKLKRLHDKKDIKGFYKLYSEYLKWNHVISTQRQILYNMAKMVSESSN